MGLRGKVLVIEREVGDSKSEKGGGLGPDQSDQDRVLIVMATYASCTLRGAPLPASAPGPSNGSIENHNQSQ